MGSPVTFFYQADARVTELEALTKQNVEINAAAKLQLETLENTLQERESLLKGAEVKVLLLEKQLTERESDILELEKSKTAVIFRVLLM